MLLHYGNQRSSLAVSRSRHTESRQTASEGIGILRISCRLRGFCGLRSSVARELPMMTGKNVTIRRNARMVTP